MTACVRQADALAGCWSTAATRPRAAAHSRGLRTRRQRRRRDPPQPNASGAPAGALTAAKAGSGAAGGAPPGARAPAPARMLSTIGSTELLLDKGGAGGRFASGDLDAASERSLSASAAGLPTHKPAQPSCGVHALHRTRGAALCPAPVAAIPPDARLQAQR